MPTPDNKREEMARDVGQKRDQTPFQDNNKRELSKCCGDKVLEYSRNIAYCKRCRTKILSSPDPFLEKTLAEFDEKFMEYAEENGNTLIDSDTDGNEVKSFIRSALNAQREEIREKIEVATERALKESDYKAHAIFTDVLALLSPHNKDL